MASVLVLHAEKEGERICKAISSHVCVHENTSFGRIVSRCHPVRKFDALIFDPLDGLGRLPGGGGEYTTLAAIRLFREANERWPIIAVMDREATSEEQILFTAAGVNRIYHIDELSQLAAGLDELLAHKP